MADERTIHWSQTTIVPELPELTPEEEALAQAMLPEIIKKLEEDIARLFFAPPLPEPLKPTWPPSCGCRGVVHMCGTIC